MAPSTAGALAWLEARDPRLARRAKRWFVERAVPANRAMGIRVVHVADDGSEVVLSLLDRRRNRNVGGTTHGGVLLALAETVHGVAVLWTFPPESHRMVSTRSEMTFLAPARGPLHARGGVDPRERARLADALAREGRAEIELESAVVDAAGVHVAQLRARYAVRRRARPAGTDPAAGDAERVKG